MYKIQKRRSRKIIHNVSIRHRQKLARKLLVLRKEMINTVQMSLKSNEKVHVFEVNDSTSSSIMQNSQNIKFIPNSYQNNDTINNIEYDNLSSNIFDVAIENKNKSNRIEYSLIPIKKKQFRRTTCFCVFKNRY